MGLVITITGYPPVEWSELYLTKSCSLFSELHKQGEKERYLKNSSCVFVFQGARYTTIYLTFIVLLLTPDLADPRSDLDPPTHCAIRRLCTAYRLSRTYHIIPIVPGAGQTRRLPRKPRQILSEPSQCYHTGR